MKVLYTTKASATGGRGGHVTGGDGLINHKLAIPSSMGGPGGEHLNPEILFAAGYAACFGSGVDYAAHQLKLRPSASRVDCTVSIGEKAGGGFQLAAKLEVHLEGVSPEEAQQIVDLAHQVCPYSNATRNNIDVELAVI